MEFSLVIHILSRAIQELHATRTAEEALSKASKSNSLSSREVFLCLLSLLEAIYELHFRNLDQITDNAFCTYVNELKHTDKENQIINAWCQNL